MGNSNAFIIYLHKEYSNQIIYYKKKYIYISKLQVIVMITLILQKQLFLKTQFFLNTIFVDGILVKLPSIGMNRS